MELGPGEANSDSTGQEACLLWNLQIHYHTYKMLSLINFFFLFINFQSLKILFTKPFCIF